MKALPVIRQPEELISKMEQWRQGLAPLLKTPSVPRIPWNFRVTECRGGNRLTWTKVDGADGYEITRTTGTDFAAASTITIEGGETSEYFDAIALSGATMPKVGYKLRATTGNAQAKHSVKGKSTYPVFGTPLDPNNTASTGTVRYDKTSDKDQATMSYRKRFQ